MRLCWPADAVIVQSLKVFVERQATLTRLSLSPFPFDSVIPSPRKPQQGAVQQAHMSPRQQVSNVRSCARARWTCPSTRAWCSWTSASREPTPTTVRHEHVSAVAAAGPYHL